MTEQPLSERCDEVLSLLVGDYIATAEAVGSRQISKKIDRRLSAATIRNVMADLEEQGFLSQPHTSAGRLPTAKGLRYYVDTLLEKRPIALPEQQEIERHYQSSRKDIPSLMKQTSKILATLSRQIGLVMTPKLDQTVFKHMEFIPLSSGRLLGIFVAQSGQVENRILEIQEPLNHREIEKINNYCNARFLGLTLEEAREKVVGELGMAEKEYDRLLIRALLLSQTLLQEIPSHDLMMDGEAQLLGHPDFSTAEKIQGLLKTLEEKQQLLNIFDSCMKSPGVRIFIGSESPINEANNLSLITSTYASGERILGTLGVIGPTAIDYSRMIGMVDFTAKLVSDLLENS